MKNIRIGTLAIAAAAGAVGACITVNIYFPAPEVRAAAEEIVEETWGAQGAPATPPAGGTSLLGPRGPRMVTLAWLHGLAGPAVAHAAEPDVNVSTAAIRAIKAAMKERAAQLKPYLTAGNVGIDAGGMLVVREPAGLSMKDRARVGRLVEAENEDRDHLYREIAKANDFGDDRIADIRAIFAETWIDKAEPGWWVQDASGGWRRAGAAGSQ